MDTSSLDQIKQPLTSFLHRYHLVIFIVVVVGVLIFVMFQINGLIQNSSADAATPPTTQTFDTATMDKVRKLHTSNQAPTPLNLSGRSSPFVE